MNDTNQDRTHVIDRRTMMKRVFALGAGAGLAATGLVAPAYAASDGATFILDVDTDGFADFDFGGSSGGATGPFYVSGNIFSPGTINPSIGTFHCWGWIRPDGLGVVNQEFDISGRGKILISGVESDAPRAVSGGTGDFARARGEGIPDLVIFDFSNTGKFRIVFNLTSAEGPPIT